MRFSGNVMVHLERVVIKMETTVCLENIDQSKIKTPKGHKLMEVHYKNGKPKYIVTTNLIRDKYYLYKITDDFTLDKLEVSNTPRFKRRTI